MVKIYVNLINAGLKTLEQVPTAWRAEVAKIINTVAE